MNKIYKSIWNHVTRTFTAVSEVKLAQGKKAKNKALGLVVIPTLAVFSSSAWSYDSSDPVRGNNENFAIGVDQPFQTDRNNTGLASGTEFLIDEKLANANLTSQSLLNMSSSIYEQQLLYTNRLYDTSGIKDGSISFSHTTVTQNQSDNAVLTFAIGSEAFDLINQNRENYLNTSGVVGIDDSTIRINGVEGIKNYFTNGLAFQSALVPSWQHYVWTLAILKEAQILANKTLAFTNLSGENTWSAKTTGVGNISYEGEGVLNLKTTLANGFDDKNTYTGTTTANGTKGGLTLNLSKNQSFGETSNLIASNATINVLTSNAWQSVNNLELTSVTTDFSSSGLSRFTVTNTGSVATFSGQNMFDTLGAFTYTINGSAEIKDGHTAFGSNTTVQVGDSLTLHSVNSLSAQSLQIGNELKFVGANGSFDQNTAAYDGDDFTVNISDQSDITYGAQDVLSGVASTVLSESSKLTLSDQSDLGSRVDFLRDDNKKPRSQVTITSTDNLEFADKGELA